MKKELLKLIKREIDKYALRDVIEYELDFREQVHKAKIKAIIEENKEILAKDKEIQKLDEKIEELDEKIEELDEKIEELDEKIEELDEENAKLKAILIENGIPF